MRGRMRLWLAAAAWLVAGARAEHVRDLEVSEGAPTGTRVGFIGDGSSSDSGPPYLIVPVPGSAVDTDLSIEQNTGEIRTKVPLDRETRASYSLVAIPLSGENVRVVVRVLDENDNAPTFPSPVMSIEFPENTPRDVKRTLNPARDLDLGIYNTQRYNIVSGNVNNAFRLSSHRERDGVLYLDLQINGFLDRETTAAYSLLIEALDGGSPPLKGQMTVNITIQDVNDNQPIFNQSRYFATVPENATVGTSILQVHATDADASENGEVEYSINRRQSDRDGMFKIDSKTGLIAVNRPLDFETKEVHELVVVAKDHGMQPLETTTFVSIRVTDVNDNQPTINVIFLSDDATPKISEMAQPGEFVARISVNDPDSKTEYSNVNVTLEGGEGHFGLATQDNIIYLVIVALPIDREQKPNYTLSVIATDTGTPPLHASKTFHLRVTDINDNAPMFKQAIYNANVLEVADPGTSVFQVSAVDIDEGENSVLTYTLQESAETHPPWFQIDPRSGLITTKSHIDCETDPIPQLTVIATDSGNPPLSSSATVLVTIHDVNDNEPIFNQSYYNVTLSEDVKVDHCFLKVSATDPDCGINAKVNYTLGEGFARHSHFSVNSQSGEVCIAKPLDYETKTVYEFPVIATDRGGLSTTAMVRVQVTDVNDNRPVFYPRQYNVSLRAGVAASGSVVAAVSASDRDSGRLGALSYQVSGGNEANLFRVDPASGELLVNQPSLAARVYRLNVSAVDGAGLRALEDAEVFVSVADKTLAFEKLRYSFTAREDVPRNTVVGAVKASSGGFRSLVRYSIVAGDAEGYFTIDPSTGALRTASTLDHEAHPFVLLNVQAISDSTATSAYTQVKIVIEDVNDNSPEFDSSTVRLSVPENAELGVPLYAAAARDVDSGRNGVVRYRLVSASSGDARLFGIDPRLGYLTLARRLDYETAQRHSLLVSATDAGEPPLSTNLTVLLEVQDVNDNPPVFERTEYAVKISESLPVDSQVVQVTAVDLDTGNNARLTYRLLAGSDVFGVFPNSGWLYLRRPLDRETRDRYSLRVAATDNGTPASSATALVTVTVLDANDNDPMFSRESYQFGVEENLPRGAPVGVVRATDKDLDSNGALRYSLIPSNSSFQINPLTGELFTRAPLDREAKSVHELVAEARDQGSPPRSARVSVRVTVTDVNDNAPDLVDPQEDVISVREEQPPGTEVVRVRAVDSDEGYNATVTYSIVKGRDTDGYGVFTVDQVSGLIRTKTVLDHEERAIYRLAVAATDSGVPPRETVRVLRVEVLDLNDNRPTFTSSSLVFKIREDVPVGYVVGNVVTSDSADGDNLVSGRAGGGHVMYTLTSDSDGAFDMDRRTGSLVVARQLDREAHPEYRLEVRALDTSTSNPQSSAVVVRVELADVNDNPPLWDKDPITISVPESAPVGSAVWNFSASDADDGSNGELRYSLVDVWPQTRESQFSVDPLTGTLTLTAPLDFEHVSAFTLVVRVTDQASNVSDRLSASLTVRVVVQDVNDNAPVFVSPASKTVNIAEDLKIGSSLCHITAVDKDSGDNARVTYTISSGNEDSKFTLGYNTGVLALARPLDISAMNGISPKYRLNITASDHGIPSKKTALLLTLVVQGSSETPPRFIHTTYHANISEDAAVGSVVMKVTAGTGSKENGVGYGNLSFHLARGVADDKFAVDAERGVVTLVGNLDRELRDHYVIPVYVMDKLFYDVATVSISVSDVNDHAPEFRPGACYPLTVPENSELSVVHTLTATDRDSGANGEITYSITGGNINNKFSIDLRTGELSARPLDREAQPRYHLVITAQDRGSPPLSGSCNVTITVEDQNDNDPRFSKLRYTATIPEDIEVGSAVLTVKASDADLGVNAKLVYSLANESQWLFHIDNRTGVITTAGLFDRERQSVYEFQVVATDGGRYDARSQKVPVQITIGDVNDNKPVFSQYPFTAEVPVYTQPGHEILHITAVDNDEGTNADIVFSFLNEPPLNKFRINPNSGSVTAASSVAMESGKLFHLEVLATDKGNPPQSATGLIEIKVGESNENMQVLRFQNSTYIVNLLENSPVGKEIVQVSAVRSDGRRQRITYSLGSGNEEGAFDITVSGVIRVRDSRLIDYETSPQIKLVVVAQADGSTGPPLYGYTQVLINLIDQNDNTPKFTQQQYSAVVWEGNNKGTFVMQVSATDMDQGANARLLYHIVDGNHDNAFVIEPPFSGLVKTNIVLDREIRDMYRLTVIATDEGVPQLTGTSTIRINIVDVNDNQPTFPPHSVISISEGKEVGSVITTVSANDVDTNPSLTYSLHEDGSEGGSAEGVFSIDRFSGKVILGRPLDFETRQEYRLRISASDTAHTAETVLTVKVTDDNDNSPVFSQPSYKANLLDSAEIGHPILTVNATDKDTGPNAEIRYSLLASVRGFTIDERSGAVQVNHSAVVLNSPWDPVLDLVVVATDSGSPPRSTTAAVRVHINNAGTGSLFGRDEFRITVNERTEKGSSLLKLGSTGITEHVVNPQYTIIDGDSDNVFQMLSPQGELILLKTLDRETKDTYLLKITSSPLADNSSALQIHVTVEDANDNPPKFANLESRVYISEGVSVGHSVLQLIANDADLPPNSDIRYDITSGNDEDLFDIDMMSGVVTVKNGLDFDIGPSEYALVIRASDNAKSPPDVPLSTVEIIHIVLEDENDNTPHFPVTEYLEFVGENEAIGSPVFTARATDIDRGAYGQLNYSIMSAAASGYTDIEDSWKLFRVDPVTGTVTTNAVFDYETRNRYAFTLTASDIGGRVAKVKVRVEIESRDEFHPQFTERTYRFVLGINDLPVGYVVGHVLATDRDKGPDGRVVYQLSSQHPYFKINRTTGVVMIKKKFDSGFDFKQDISLVVTASSGRQGSLTNMSVVEIALDPLADTENNIVVTGNGNESALAATGGGIADWAMGLLIALILVVIAFGAVFLFLHVRNRRHKKVNKPGLSGGQSTDTFVDPSAFDTIPIRGGVAGPASQFGPPKYDEIPTYRNNNTGSSNSGAATTSELSGSEQSGSSGRGSAEDGEDVEDEEIRMINEGPLQREGLHRTADDEDNISDVSVHNTQEYLARLGIVDSQGGSSASRRHSESLVAGSSKDGLLHHQGVPIDGLMFDEDANGENDITNLIYAKLNDVSGSERGSSTKDVDGGSSSGALGAAVDHVMVLGGFGDVPTGTHQPSMTGSLSSIVHSEEELTGSYNWDYLLDWGPQYQPLAHVFSEIARLKDDAASVKSGNSGTSSGKGKNCIPPVVKTVPPPLLTSVAPRSIAAPVLSARNPHHSSVVHQPAQLLLLPRSPISHDASGAGFSTSTAMSPSFSPSLSPLATRSPSISPLVTPGVPTSHHVRQRTTLTTDSELRI